MVLKGLRQKFKEFNILAFAFQHNFDYVMYVKKNTNDFTEIGDVHNVNTKLGLNLAHL